MYKTGGNELGGKGDKIVSSLEQHTTEIAGVKTLDSRAGISWDDILQEIDDPNDFPVVTHQNRFVLPHTGTFSDKELRVALELGHIVCDPAPDPNHGARINGSSIDVTVGHQFYTAGKHGGGGIFNPFTQDGNYRYFDVDSSNPESGFKVAEPWVEVRRKLNRDALDGFAQFLEEESYVNGIDGIPENHPMILLRPNERILTHTHEFIGIRPPGTTSMQARSTTGRIGLSACYCAGWGDPGYIDRWTMEVHNLNENEFIPVPVGFRMAQVVFNSTGPVQLEYSKASGNYQAQSSANLTAVKQAWRPHHMLPKAYKNEVVLPTAVDGLVEGLK